MVSRDSTLQSCCFFWVWVWRLTGNRMNPGFIHQFATEGIISPESTQVVFHFCHQSIFQTHHKLGTLFWSLATFYDILCNLCYISFYPQSRTQSWGSKCILLRFLFSKALVRLVSLKTTPKHPCYKDPQAPTSYTTWVPRKYLLGTHKMFHVEGPWPFINIPYLPQQPYILYIDS